MLIMVTNDDGYEAPGLWVAYDLAHKLGDKTARIAVVAPHSEQSGVGHAMSYLSPIRAEKRREDHFTVEGTPTDCVILAEDLLGAKPDLVLSGVNMGHNLGPDALYSGTIGAAIEATANGIPAIAMSQYYSNERREPEAAFDSARGWGLRAINVLWQAYGQNWPMGRFFNINFPKIDAHAVKGIKAVNAEPLIKTNVIARKQTAPNSRDYYWLGHPGPLMPRLDGHDVAAVHDHYVSVSAMKLDLNDAASTAALDGLYAGGK